MLPKIGSDTFAGRASNSRAYLLNRDHQRIRKQKRPCDGETELGARLRIGGNSARIVIRRTRNEARTEYPQQPRLAAASSIASRFLVFLRTGFLIHEAG